MQLLMPETAIVYYANMVPCCIINMTPEKWQHVSNTKCLRFEVDDLNLVDTLNASYLNRSFDINDFKNLTYKVYTLNATLVRFDNHYSYVLTLQFNEVDNPDFIPKSIFLKSQQETVYSLKQEWYNKGYKKAQTDIKKD
jgi:hypothetical protein